MFFYLLSNLTVNEIHNDLKSWTKKFENHFKNPNINELYGYSLLRIYLFRYIAKIVIPQTSLEGTFDHWQYLLRFPDHADQGSAINDMLHIVKTYLYQYYNEQNFPLDNRFTQEKMIESIEDLFKNNDNFLKILFSNIANNPEFSFSQEDPITIFFLDLSKRLQQLKNISFDNTSLNLSSPNTKFKNNIIAKENFIEEITKILKKNFNFKVVKIKKMLDEQVIEIQTKKNNEIINIIFIHDPQNETCFLGGKRLGYFIVGNCLNTYLLQHELGHAFQAHYEEKIGKSIYKEVLTTLMEQVSDKNVITRYNKKDIYGYFMMFGLYNQLIQGKDLLPYWKDFLIDKDISLFRNKTDEQLENFLKNITACYFHFIENRDHPAYFLGIFLNAYYLKHNTKKYTIDTFKDFYTKENSLEGWLKFLGVSLPDFTDWVFQEFFIKNETESSLFYL
jgi:hypothetical protein